MFYVPILLRRSTAARIGLAIGIGGIVGIGALGLISPSSTTATKPLPAIVPLTQAEFTSSIAADQTLSSSVELAFSGPMDQKSVAAALDVTPATPVHLAWDRTGTRVTVSPAVAWKPDAYYTVSVRAGALGATGRPIEKAARAVFLTRSATNGTIAATAMAGKAAAVSTGFKFTFNRPVTIADVRKALMIDPLARGALDVAASEAGSTAFVFTPSEPLATATQYTVGLGSLVDASGSPVADVPALTITTADAPTVVRFRPKNNTKDVERGAVLSVRFTESMNRKSTKAAFAVTANGKPVAGKTSFAEKDTVLVFRPNEPLPYSAVVQMTVKATALSAGGAPIEAATAATIHVEAKPAPAAPRPAAARPTSSKIPTGGKSVGGGSWGAVESYYLRLMNCTRTGGWVTSGGSCSSPGGRNVAALKLDSGISSKVSRPYAKRLAVNNQCSHFIGGNPGDRLRAAGYSSYIWAENLGCRSGDPYAAALGSHLFFQSEQSYNGGHYVNLMNSKYDRVGIGVWASGGRVRLVIDFYHPR